MSELQVTTDIKKVEITIERTTPRSYRAVCTVESDDGQISASTKDYRNKSLMQVQNELHKLKRDFLKKGLTEDKIIIGKPAS